VTQVLSELEFTVEACLEPFAAVKRLMGEHFDAVVVDCDNEQNATLLFKSARNSTSNQASLAVAVVEGQAGVAKAFRIGANLVLTKPINIEQSKGTLRVARGLLRKGEPGKTTAPSAAAAASAAKPAAPKAPAPVKPATPVAAAPKPAPPAPKPATSPAFVATASASPAPASQVQPAVPETKSEAPAAPKVAATEPKPAFSAPTSFGGAASAPAPARETSPAPEPPSVEAPAPAAQSEIVLEPAAETAPSAPTSFTFGGAATPAESSGGSKKTLLIAAAVVLAAVGGYFAWSFFGNRPAQPSSQQNAQTVSPSPASAQPAGKVAKPAATGAPATAPVVQPAAGQPSSLLPASAQTAQPPAPTAADDSASDDGATTEKSTPSSTKSSARPTKAEPTPLMVKGGSAPALKSRAAAADAPAPSLIGMATPAAGAPLNLNTSGGPKPVLQTLNISQGVSQGLLIKKVQPIYPHNALAMHVEGSVELLATISTSGNITAIKILSGEQLLTRAAADAVKQWKYKPYLLNGEPVEIQTQVTVNFKLPH